MRRNLTDLDVINKNMWMRDLVEFRTEENPLSLFIGIKIKTHFSLLSPYFHFVQIIMFFNCQKQQRIECYCWQKVLDLIYDEIIYITITLLFMQEEHWTFIETCCFLSIRKFAIELIKFPIISICLTILIPHAKCC